MKLGSLFDGSGGFPLAGHDCGVETAWMSEIEPYPIAVTKNIFTSAKHLGDISKINGAEIEPVDIITFGSPCQDLSVAGKRAGLKHEANGDDETTRSGLFMEAVRIIKEMRDATNGKYPRFALWENVPGAFSSNKGEDFRIVCEELIKIVEPCAVMPAVPKRGWAYADSYCGDGWSLAYRVFDAQYWGVPQRRRRIHLVLDLGGECARKVLFEREGVRGDFTPYGAERETAPGCAENCFGTADRKGTPYLLKIRSGCEGGGKGALIQECLSVTLATNNDQYLFQPVLLLDDQGGQQISVRTDGKSPTLRAEMHGNIPCVMDKVYSIENHPADSRVNIDESGKVQTLTSRMGTGGGNVPIVMELAVVYACSSKQQSLAVTEDIANTLGANDYKEPQVVCMATQQGGAEIRTDDKAPTITAAAGMSGNNQPVICLQGNGIDRADTAGCNGKGWREDQCYTLNTIDRPAVCYRQGSFADYVEGEIGTLKASGGDLGGGSENIIIEQQPQYIVRRLTPTECARLQGFPDFWGHFAEKEDFTDDEYRFWLDVRNTHAEINGKAVKEYTKEQMVKWCNKLHTDSAEYKMWGNGIALPPAIYCMQGMVEVLKERVM